MHQNLIPINQESAAQAKRDALERLRRAREVESGLATMGRRS